MYTHVQVRVQSSAGSDADADADADADVEGGDTWRKQWGCVHSQVQPLTH